MKVQELIDQLKGYEDFDLEVGVFVQDGTKYSSGVYSGAVTGIADIGHASQLVSLDFDNAEIEGLINGLVGQIKELEEALKD